MTRTLITAGAVTAALAFAGCGESGNGATTKDTAPRILFAADGDIVAVNPDGSGRRTLLKTEDIELTPRWSPDRSRIAFVRSDGALYVMNADGTGVRRVTEPRAGTGDPAWSGDGRRLTFSAQAGQAFALFEVGADGTGQRRLRGLEHGWIGDADFTADDRLMAFSEDPSEVGGHADLWTMDAGGGARRRVTRGLGHVGGPRWRPDGRQLLYGVGGSGIFTADPDGSGRRRLTGDRLNADTLSVAWSPDAKRIAWTAKYEGGGGSAIYVMNADGTGMTKITEPLLSATSVDW